MFAGDDIEDVLARLYTHSAELVGELGQYWDSYRLCYLRGPDGIIVALAEQLSRGLPDGPFADHGSTAVAPPLPCVDEGGRRSGPAEVRCRRLCALTSPAEVRLEPDLLAKVLLHLRDVAERGRVTPLAREPGTKAAPDVALVVVNAPRHAVEPRLVADVTCAPDPVRGIGIHRSRPGNGRPAAVPIGVLQDPVGHRALARLAVLTGLVTGRAVGWVRGPATESALLPPALHGRLGEHDVLVDAPLAGRPPEYVDRGASEVPIDPPGQLLRAGAVLGKEPRADVATFPVVIRLVGRPVLRERRGVDETGAVWTGGQLRTGPQGVKVDGGLAESSRRRTAGSARGYKRE